MTNIVAALAGLAALVGGFFAVKQSGVNKGRQEERAKQYEDVANATSTRNTIKDDVAASSDDAVRQRLRDKWTKPGN